MNGVEYAWPFVFLRRRSTIIVWHGLKSDEVQASGAPRVLVEPAALIYRELEKVATRAICQIAVSPAIADRIQMLFRLRTTVQVVVNGCKLESSSGGQARSHGKVVWVGTSAFKKGLDLALEACSIARTSVPNLELHIFGYEPLSVPFWVHCHGRVSPAVVHEHLRECHLYLCTSRYEACSITVLEAMAAGALIVGSPTIDWMISGLGVSVEALNPPEIAKKIVFAVSSGMSVKQSSYDSMLAHFNWPLRASDYITTIEDLHRAQSIHISPRS